MLHPSIPSFTLALAILTAPLTPATAQVLGCPTDTNIRLANLSDEARAGRLSPGDLAAEVDTIVKTCGSKRVILSQVLAAFTGAGLAIAPPDDDRFRAHLQAFRTAGGLARGKAGPFDPVPLGEAPAWTVADERNAYWDLMFAMSGDFLVFGAHGDLYNPASLDRIGCGLYPDEEASALATHARENVDGGELVARVHYLGANCDTAEVDTSGQAALYFEAHLKARGADPGYVGLTENDIRAGLSRFLTDHLDGASASDLFAADAVVQYLSE